MKNILSYTLLCTLCLTLFTACDSKWDKNGDLDGMWQLTEWREKATNQVVKTNDDSIYYCVQLNLIKFQRGSREQHYLSYFTHTEDSLFIGKTVSWPSDKVSPVTDLKFYGIPSDGRLRIDALNRNRMVLSCEQWTLSFRKY